MIFFFTQNILQTSVKRISYEHKCVNAETFSIYFEDKRILSKIKGIYFQNYQIQYQMSLIIWTKPKSRCLLRTLFLPDLYQEDPSSKPRRLHVKCSRFLEFSRDQEKVQIFNYSKNSRKFFHELQRRRVCYCLSWRVLYVKMKKFFF